MNDKETDYIHALNHFIKTLPNLRTAHEIFWFIAKNVMPFLEIEDCVLYEVDDECNILIQKAAWGISEDLIEFEGREFTIPLGVGIVGLSAKIATMITIEDTRLDERYVVENQCMLSECAVPLLYEDRVIGVLDSEHSQVNFFTQIKMQQLQTLASLMSLRLGRSIVERELQVSVDKLLNTGKLHEFYFIISTLRESSATNIDFYRILHGFIKEIMYAENFYIGLYNQNQAVVRFPYVTNKLNNVHEPTCVPITELHNSILLYAIEQNRPLLLTHTAIELLGKKNKYCITKNDLEIDTWLSVPFNVDKYIQGIIVVKSYDKGHHYLEHDKDLLRFVAAQISSFFKYKQIKYLAEHDVLTGLANRTVYSDRLQHCIDHYRRDRKQNFSVLMIDLDEFKRINDDFGHGTGDLILKEVSRRLLECVRDFDTVSRFGGDEFSIILEQISSDHAVNKIADRIVKTMAKPCILKCGEFNLSVSVGICNSMPEASGDIMMKYADQALYEAKASGRNCYRRYHAKHNL